MILRSGGSLFRRRPRLLPSSGQVLRAASSSSSSSSSDDPSSSPRRPRQRHQRRRPRRPAPNSIFFGDLSPLRLVLEPARASVNSLLDTMGSPIRVAHYREADLGHVRNADEALSRVRLRNNASGSTRGDSEDSRGRTKTRLTEAEGGSPGAPATAATAAAATSRGGPTDDIIGKSRERFEHSSVGPFDDVADVDFDTRWMDHRYGAGAGAASADDYGFGDTADGTSLRSGATDYGSKSLESNGQLTDNVAAHTSAEDASVGNGNGSGGGNGGRGGGGGGGGDDDDDGPVPLRLRHGWLGAPRAVTPPRADTIVSKEAVKAYVESVLRHPKRVHINNPLVPEALEKQLYILVVRIVLHLIHRGIGELDQQALFGRLVRVAQKRSADARSMPARCDLDLDPALIDSIASQAFAATGSRPVVSEYVDRVMYTNTVRFALRLASDVLMSVHITVFGLEIKMDVQRRDELVCADTAATDAAAGWDEAELAAAFGPIVDDLLRDESINLSFVPDDLEKILYFNIIKLLLNVAAAGVGQFQLDVFGVQANSRFE